LNAGHLSALPGGGHARFEANSKRRYVIAVGGIVLLSVAGDVVDNSGCPRMVDERVCVAPPACKLERAGDLLPQFKSDIAPRIISSVAASIAIYMFHN
jgi:hypothetical protein